MPVYQVARRIGSGGMAEVLLACQQGPGGFEKLVVIKRILSQFHGDERFVSMFLAEARLAASLKHPNIVEIYDVIREHDQFAIVMEYVSGEDLRCILDSVAQFERRLPVPLICQIAVATADALHCAHSATDAEGNVRSIVHGDISPSNIMVTYGGYTKVVDFGLAKVPSKTLPGHIQGNLLYCSPEQVNSQQLDERSDLFSLGTVLHEMLTSRKLFVGPSEAAIVRNIMERPIPPPSIYNHNVPLQLDEIVLRLLDRDPNTRTPTAAHLRNDLEALLHAFGDSSDRAIGQWLTTILAERHAMRLAVERQVTEDARRKALPADSASLPLFVPSATDSATYRSGSSPPLRRATTGSLLPGAASPDTASAHTTSQPFPYAPTGSSPFIQGINVPLPPKRRRSLVVLASFTLSALLVGAAAASFVTLRRSTPPVVETPPQPQPAAQTADPVKDPAVEKAEIPSAALRLHAVPHGATITVDGEPFEKQIGPDGLLVPVTPSKEIRIAISKKGYSSHEATLLSPSSGVMPVYVTLTKEVAAKEKKRDVRRVSSRSRRPSSGTLVLDFKPSDASIVIDGKVRSGQSPQKLQLKQGRHMVQVTASGHIPMARTFELRGGATERISIQLQREPPKMGKVSFSSTPAGAKVSIDGNYRGETPLKNLIELPAGKSVAVELTLDGYKKWSKRITPATNEVANVVATLEPIIKVQPKAKAKPKAKPKPPPKPVKISASDVTKVSGDLPSIRVRNVEQDGSALARRDQRWSNLAKNKPISAYLCIDTRGRVTSVTLGSSAPARMTPTLRRALMSWRYKPYRSSGRAVPACFINRLQLKIKPM